MPCFVVSGQEKTPLMGKAVVSACCWNTAAAFLGATWLLGWALKQQCPLDSWAVGMLQDKAEACKQARVSVKH